MLAVLRCGTVTHLDCLLGKWMLQLSSDLRDCSVTNGTVWPEKTTATRACRPWSGSTGLPPGPMVEQRVDTAGSSFENTFELAQSRIVWALERRTERQLERWLEQMPVTTRQGAAGSAGQHQQQVSLNPTRALTRTPTRRPSTRVPRGASSSRSKQPSRQVQLGKEDGRVLMAGREAPQQSISQQYRKRHGQQGGGDGQDCIQ